jgi:hypothetical protein
MKNKELRRMKALAATILSQRTETEQFFLESLGEVKEMIRQERKRNPVEARVAANKLKSGAGGNAVTAVGKPVVLTRKQRGLETGRFPPLNIKAANIHHMEQQGGSMLPATESDNVLLSDLSWSDKETVLRVLFAKINGIQKEVNRTVEQGSPRGATSNGAEPVFISEGTDLPDSAEAMYFQRAFELDYDGENDED